MAAISTRRSFLDGYSSLDGMLASAIRDFEKCNFFGLIELLVDMREIIRFLEFVVRSREAPLDNGNPRLPNFSFVFENLYNPLVKEKVQAAIVNKENMHAYTFNCCDGRIRDLARFCYT
jgi:hypothetical protein